MLEGREEEREIEIKTEQKEKMGICSVSGRMSRWRGGKDEGKEGLGSRVRKREREERCKWRPAQWTWLWDVWWDGFSNRKDKDERVVDEFTVWIYAHVHVCPSPSIHLFSARHEQHRHLDQSSFSFLFFFLVVNLPWMNNEGYIEWVDGEKWKCRSIQIIGCSEKGEGRKKMWKKHTLLVC